MRNHSKAAWDIASRYSDVLASETRDLASAIDAALAEERETLADRLLRRAAGFEARGDTIFNGKIIADELRTWASEAAASPLPASAARRISVNGLANDTLFALKGLYGAENDPHRDGDAIGIISKPLNDLTQECLAGMREIAALRQELEARPVAAGREEIARVIFDAICDLRFPRAVAIDLPIMKHLEREAGIYADAVLALSARQDLLKDL